MEAGQQKFNTSHTSDAAFMNYVQVHVPALASSSASLHVGQQQTIWNVVSLHLNVDYYLFQISY